LSRINTLFSFIIHSIKMD